MRKYILLLIAFCLHIAARGQTGWKYEYWYDDNRASARQGISTADSWHVDADISNLSESLHAFHLQVVGNDTLPSAPITRYFIKTANMWGTTCRYWFDDDNDNKYTAPHMQGAFNIDVKHLDEGFHTIHYLVEGTGGSVSSIVSRSFYKVYLSNDIRWRCWFDNDFATVQEGNNVDNTLLLDVTRIADGYHTLHIQIDGGSGAVSVPITKGFIKIPQTIGVEDYTCLCMVDDKLFRQERVHAGRGIVEWNLDVSQLPQGFHRMFVQIVTPSGAASNTYESFFLRETTRAEFGEMKCVYAIDGAEFYTEAGTMANGTYHFDLDVASLDDGLHRIAYMLSNGKGVTTKTQSQFFIKTPLGGNGITEYWYWLNEQDEEQVKKITLPERQDPFSLITLLPVEGQPVRSKLFQFLIKDNSPIVYAKNDIHIRFYDAAGRFKDVTKQFVDESVKKEVEPVGDLQTTQTFPKVTENDILWYTMKAAPGDTVAFKLSQTATLQVFSPSGKEVFKTSESASMQWGGIHTGEDGTYYVAVHDVTGSQSNMTLDYMHMDKYDVVDWDVHTVGNGGCSTITFKGNGFRDLYAVDLYTAAGDSIHAVDISHESDAETAVTFDFSGAKLGGYNAVFHFTQEDKHFANIETVEEAVDIELATDVTFPSTFLRGTSTTYTVKITNKGNMTAYQVPIELKLKNSSINNISFIEFGEQLSSLSNEINSLSNDSIDKEIINELLAVWHNTGDLSQFAFIHDSIDNVDYGISFIFLNLPPKTTRQITVTVKSSSDVYLSAYTTSDWLPISASDYLSKNGSRMMSARANIGDWVCCYRERVECVADVVGSIISALPGVPPNINCGYQAINTIAQVMYDIGCSEGSLTERFHKYAESKGQSLVGRIRKTAFDCVIGYFFGRINPLRDDLKLASQLGNGTEAKRLLNEIQTLQAIQRSAINKLYNSGSIIVSAIDCINKFRTPIPNCPPNPGGGGGTSTPQPPADPNDIYGYLSEAGSKFMTDEVAKVNYTIEFENDTTFAQASAHTIAIRDTLDNRYFDLKSFVPTSVKIGEHETFLDEATDVKKANGVTSFLKTIDMRPEINAIAQVEGEYVQQTGIAKWTFSSLDPMTMEPTNDLMQGILPVNYDGTSGIGEVMFEVGVKPNKADGTQIPNRASIVFDYEEPILTPIWTNIVDATAPESHITDVKMLNDSTATISIAATDELSGPWRYDVYVQYGEGSAWWKAAENIPIDTTASVKVYEGINHGFYVVVTDSAGNVEKKVAEREFTLDVFGSLEETNTSIELAQGWNWISHNQQSTLSVDALKPASTQIVGQTKELTNDPQTGWTGNLDELLPTQMYKIQVNNPQTIQLSGSLFNSAFRSIPLYQGWNWIGYPVANAMTPTEALAKLEAEEGDFLIGQDGFVTFSDGQWTGTLLVLTPGLGYIYRSASDKNLYYNVTAQASARRTDKSRAVDSWTVDKHKYPNVMAVTAQLYKDGIALDANEWLIAAFCGDECRGVASIINGLFMMNVYGTYSESIQFYVMNRVTEEVLIVTSTESFRADILGTISEPYNLDIGNNTGIRMISDTSKHGYDAVYDLQGRRVKDKMSAINAQLQKGIYVVTDSKNTKPRKVVIK